MIITFIQEPNSPIYSVDFDQYKTKEEPTLTTLKKTQACAQRSFQLIGFFLGSFKDSVYTNLGNAGISFKYTVLGYYGPLIRFSPPSDIYLAVFKVVFWVATLGWGISATTARLFREKISSGQATILLKEFANDGINVEHMKTEELGLNVSSVPDDVTVNDLRNILNKINFTNRQAPGYMPPTTRKEDNQILTKEQLQERLENFIRRVNTREAFLGTPPSYDVPRLMDFYQQIEDAVRLSIHKVTSDVNDFEQQNGTNYVLFDEEKRKKYSDLLETQARVALDLAIAGAHCGARYMGEAMDVYYTLYGEGLQNDKDLQGTLLEILAEKRKEIARGDIQKYLGADTHAFTKYMGNMGKLIGIPGTKNIIEHLSKSFNIYDFLDKFFQSYTVDVIIETIQKKARVSQEFREKITDWIKDQVGDWNRQQWDEKTYPIIRKLEEVLQSSLETTSLANNFKALQELLANLKKEKISLPEMKNGWDSFLMELLLLDATKKRYSLLDRNKIQLDCSVSALGSELIEKLQKEVASEPFTPIEPKHYMPIFIEKAKISEMKKFLLSHGLVMQQDTLFRVLRGEIDLAESVKNCIDHARREDFLSCLSQDQDLDLIVEKGLSKELLEWLLVSQGILHPQVEHGLEIIESPIDPVLSKQYINVVYEGFYNNPKTSEAAKRSLSLETLYGLLGKRNKELLQELSTYASATSKERYSNNIGSKKENILIWIFHQSFQHNPDNVITAAEIANGGKTVYPHWKKVCLIQLPKIPANLLANPIFQVAFIVSTLAISILSVYRAHEAIKHLFVTKGVPFIINHVPLQIIQAANGMLKTKDFLWKNSLKIILVSWLLKQSVARLPNIPYLSAAIRTINVWAIINVLLHSPQSLLSFAVTTSFNVLLGVWDLSKQASYQFHRISSNADKERLALCRKEALGLWKSCVTR